MTCKPLPWRPGAGVRGAAAALIALALAGCGGFSSIAPGDSAQSVTGRVGKPTTVWKNGDGSELWQYPQGYYATQTFIVTVDANRRVEEVHQALSEPYFSRVQAGMMRDDVLRLLGRPREIWYFGARDEEVWTWRYYDTAYMFFNVIFDRARGTVRSVQRLEEVPPPSGGARPG
ncbi:MAG TPA: hypothetical protein VLV56_16135 [Burkholderiales bacterium]|nr:hypothetical protein [Burkholderiales bacterium]